MKDEKFTAETCWQYVKENGGKLYKHSGGFWTISTDPPMPLEHKHFTTHIVNTLIRKGRMRVVREKSGYYGPYAVEVEVV